MNRGIAMKKLVIKADEYKICPKCLRLYPKRYNYCPQEDDLIEKINVEFE